MQPTNRAERRKASLNFMLLFLVCTAIIITTVFYSTRIPIKQNEQLVAEKKIVTKRDELKNNFTERLVDVSSMIDSLGSKNPVEVSDYSLLIDKKISELGSLLPNTVDDDTKLYAHVMKNLNHYYEAKKAVKKGIETTSKEKEYEAEIKRLDDKNRETYAKYMECLSK